MDGKRIFGYDFIKALAMLFVVIYHFGSINYGVVPEEGWYIPNFPKVLLSLCSAGVPLFFMVNGTLTANKPTPLEKTVKKSGRLLFVAVIWTVFFTCLVTPLLYGRQMPGIMQFYSYYWFLYSLVLLYLVNWFFQDKPVLRKVLVSVIFVFPFVTNFVWTLLVAYDSNIQMPSWGHTGFFSLYAIVYYYLGRWLSIKRCPPPQFCVIMILLGMLAVNLEVSIMSTYEHSVYDGVNHSFPTIGAMIISIGLFMLMRDMSMARLPRLKDIISIIGNSTIGIYVFHRFFVELFRNYVFLNKEVNFLSVYLCAVVVVVVTTVITRLILKSKCRILLQL